MGVPTPVGEAGRPGLIMLQIDGLSRDQMERALARGNLPFLSKMIHHGHYTLETFYSGVPSTTPAVQGEIFFGVRAAVPSFQFMQRSTGKVLRMYEATAAAAVEASLGCPHPLLEGGRCYSNIYRAGAERSRYCSEDLAPDELLKHLHPLKGLALLIVHAPIVFRIAGLTLLELALAVVDAFRGLYHHQNALKEIAFVPARVIVCILLRELVRFRVLLDIERGVRVIHANFLGYDEQAHRRGPGSAFAHWTLKGIDRTFRDIFRAAERSDFRDYETIVYSDHGQERSEPFTKRHGKDPEDAFREVFAHGPLAGRDIWMRRIPEMVGGTLERCLHLLGRDPSKSTFTADAATQIVVTAMGPLGHIYLPSEPAPDEMESYARELVRAGVPLVLLRPRDGAVKAFNSRGVHHLPADRVEVLGSGHPFLDEAAADLVRLCGHPDAGDFIISGWDPERAPLTFPLENGAHGGPGSEETRGLLLVPDRIRHWHMRHLPATRTRVRGEDLRKIALHFLDHDGSHDEDDSPEHLQRFGNPPLRVMTYNIHSCAGIDGKIRPERIARVINRFSPDIVAVQEVDSRRRRSGGHDQADLIAAHLRMKHVFHAMFEEEKERYGIAVFARHPFTVVKSGFLTPPEPRLFREARGAIWLRFDQDDGPPIHFFNTHFGLGRAERRNQVDELLGNAWLGSLPDREAVVLCGDLNSMPNSYVCRRLRERFADAQLALRGHRPQATFSSVRPLLRIDHIFVSRHFVVREVERPATVAALVASDHLPLCAELFLQPGP